MKLTILALLALSGTSAYKVLIFSPISGHSHMNFMGKIADILIDAGNHVTLLMPIFDESKRDDTGTKNVLIEDIHYVEIDDRTRDLYTSMGGPKKGKKIMWKLGTDAFAMIQFAKNMTLMFRYQCDKTFRETEILEKLRAEKFDLGISEPFFICGFALFDYLGINTTISADSTSSLMPVRKALGEPAAASYVPGSFAKGNDKMTLLERAKNVADTIMGSVFVESVYNAEMDAIQDIYNRKTWEELIAMTGFAFINSNPYIDFPQPNLPKTVYVGGMQVYAKGSTNIKLSQEWDELLSRRKTNVLLSFGSNAHSEDMPDEFKEAFLDVFASMPDTTFIWKYEQANATLAAHLKNVHLTTWMPQNALLGDPRLTVFITHGGLGSSIELAYMGKAAVVIPLFGDQMRNAQMLARHGGAVVLAKTFLSDPKVIGGAVKKVLDDPRYAANAQNLANILQDQPYHPREIVLKYCNFVVKHGALASLDAQGRHQSFVQYYLIDVFAAILAVVTFLLFLIALILRFFYRRLRAFVSRAKKTKTE